MDTLSPMQIQKPNRMKSLIIIAVICAVAYARNNRVSARTDEQKMRQSFNFNAMPPGSEKMPLKSEMIERMYFNFSRYFNNNLGGKVIVSLINTCMLEIHK